MFNPLRFFSSPKFIISVLYVVITAGSLAEAAYSQRPRTSKKTTVYVLATLHQFHADSKTYSFEGLSAIIRSLRPDVICVELTPADLKSRKPQKTKQEYQKSVFPMAYRYGLEMVPLEPDEPLFSSLVSLNVQSDKRLRETSADKAAAFSIYNDALYGHLFSAWDSPLAVNSPATDAQFEVKHDFQNALYGPDQERVWREWNEHFLRKILETADRFKGKRVLVLVGVEHTYWLRHKLRERTGVSLVEPKTFLK